MVSLFTGHKHSYQRTYPVLNNTVQTSYATLAI